MNNKTDYAQTYLSFLERFDVASQEFISRVFSLLKISESKISSFIDTDEAISYLKDHSPIGLM